MSRLDRSLRVGGIAIAICYSVAAVVVLATHEVIRLGDLLISFGVGLAGGLVAVVGCWILYAIDDAERVGWASEAERLARHFEQTDRTKREVA